MRSGVAPVPASSGQNQRMRLNRGGNGQLNRALYAIAMAQAVRHPPARAFLAREAAEHKSAREGDPGPQASARQARLPPLLEGAASLSQAA
jgi:transposase